MLNPNSNIETIYCRHCNWFIVSHEDWVVTLLREHQKTHIEDVFVASETHLVTNICRN